MIKPTTYCSYLLASLAFCLPVLANAAGTLNVKYNPDTDILNLKVSDVYLDDVISQLADKLGFKVVLDGNDIHRLVSIDMEARTPAVLDKLIQPNSLIISQAGAPPNRVTNVILLPEGEESRAARIRANMRPPTLTDNAEDNAYRIADYERRVERRIQGLGRHKE